MTEITTGAVLAGRYTIGRQLGLGGNGVVWQARDSTLGREVALKVVSNGEHARLSREARAAAQVSNSHVVAVHDAGEDDGTVFVVMELVQGVDLGHVLRVNGPLPAEVAALLGRDLANGLAAIHEQGIIHRDIKPSNVLLTKDGQVKLSDLGIARSSDVTQTTLTEPGTIVGTIDYLAPEQISDQETTAATDVYSLGLLLLEVCTGDKPFGEGTVAERAAGRLTRTPEPPHHLHQDLRSAIGAAVRRDPEERPADGRAFAMRLVRAVVSEDGARAELADLVARTAARRDEEDAARRDEEDAERSARPGRASGDVEIPTQQYVPTGVNDSPAAATGSGATGEDSSTAPRDDASLLEALPPPARLAAEAVGLVCVVVLAIVLGTALVS